MFSVIADTAFKNGQVGDYLFLGNMVYTVSLTSSISLIDSVHPKRFFKLFQYVVVTVCLKAGLETSAWTWLSHLAIWGSIVSWFLFLAVYSHVWPVVDLASEMVGMDKYVYGCSIFWTGLILIPTSCLVRDVAWKV